MAITPRAVAFARSLLKRRDNAEDVVQDCFIRLLQKDYDLPRDGNKILFRAITNACINDNTRKKQLLSLNTMGSRSEQSHAWDISDPAAVVVVEQMIFNEMVQEVGEGLQQLPEVQRAAIELKALGHTQQEIAEMLQTSPGNVGVILFRARQSLAMYLNRPENAKRS